MKIGCCIEGYGQPADFDDQIRVVVQAEKDGYESIWLGSQKEPLVTVAAAARETTTVEFMSAVVISYIRHPLALAQQALTTNAAAKGRFVLGIGPANRPSVERLGFTYDRSAAAMREYTSIVKSLIETRSANVHGEFYKAESTSLNIAWGEPMPVLISALGPAMLKVAGEVADGTVTWMAGIRTVEAHIAPRLLGAAKATSREGLRIAVGLPVAVCDDELAGRATGAEQFKNYVNGLHYRRLVDMEGGRIEDVVICGDEKSVEAQLRALSAAGATHFYAYPYAVGDDADKSLARTNELVTGLAGKIS